MEKEQKEKEKFFYTASKQVTDARKSNNKGITLIALIVTIIVLLILAAVTITIATREDGVVGKAKKATTLTELAQIGEDAKLITSDLLISKSANGDFSGVAIADILGELQEKVQERGYTIETDTSGTPKANVKFKLNGTEISDVKLSTGETKEVAVVIDYDASSDAKYYVVIRGKSYELKMENSSPVISSAEINRTPNSDKSITLKGATSSATSVATVALDAGKVKITGVANGNANVTISLNNSSETKTLPVTVATIVSVEQAINENKLKVGDTVVYTPAGKSVTVSGDYSGTGSDQTLNANNNPTEFKVWKIDKGNKTIQLIKYDTSNKLTLKGATGYNNSVQILNNVCSQLYSNSSKGITARSLDAKDIEDAMVDNGKDVTEVAKSASSSYTVQYGQKNDGKTDPRDATKKNPSKYTSWTNIPSIYGTYTGSDDADISSKQDDLRLPVKTDFSDCIKGKASTKAKSLTVKQTGYYPNLSSYITTEQYNVIKAWSCWLASRCVNAYSYNVDFSVRVLDSGYFGHYGLYYSNGSNGSPTLALCPSVFIGASGQLQYESTNKWVLE